MSAFKIVCPYSPAGDQPEAIRLLNAGLDSGAREQVLLGVTGSGKTFTMANVIEKYNRPTLIISHNKTLAAQLYAEFKSFFPKNAVEYFVSYFDYYQPEAYIPRTDTYIEKDSSVNEEIERLRLSATSSLLSRQDVLVVSSVSCIYGVGSRDDFEAMAASVEVGQRFGRRAFLEKLVDLQYARDDRQFERGQFRVRGDTVDLRLAYREDAVRIEFFGEEVDRIQRFDPQTGYVFEKLDSINIYPGKQFATPPDKLRIAQRTIKEELVERLDWYERNGKYLEAQRLKTRVEYDLEIIREMGYCSGIENYSRHLDGRAEGTRPGALLDFFPKDFLLIIDESHATVPQIGGMYAGDHARKSTLVEHGFRLPSALDNRPMNYDEFRQVQGPTIYVSATPGPKELNWCRGRVVEQIVRPTGLVDPPVTIKPLNGQIDDLIEEARTRVEKGQRILVTTLTKKTAETLTDYLRDIGIKVRYLHSEIDTIERVEILRSLRKGDFDVLVGINLLREGLDIPEVALVAILDADKEGYLRSTTSLIQTAGRAARNEHGEVILYADQKTKSIQAFLATTEYRRSKQLEYNQLHGITPRSTTRPIEESLSFERVAKEVESAALRESGEDYNVVEILRELEAEMLEAADKLEFEKAALLRDQIQKLKATDQEPGTATKASSFQSSTPRKKFWKKKKYPQRKKTQ